MSKKIFVWGNYDGNDRVLTIKECLKEQGYIVTEDRSGNKYKNFYLSDAVYIPPMMHKIYKTFICKILKKRMICDIYAPLYDTTVNDYKKYKKYNPIAIRHFLRDYFAMIFSDPIIFLNESESKHFISSIKLNKEKINYAILRLYRSEKPKAKLPYYYKKNSILTLCWTGTFIPLQGVEKIIETVKILKSSSLRFRLLIFGPDNKYKLLYKKIVQDEALDDVVLFPDIWGDLEKWEKIVSDCCDISLGIFGDSLKAKNVVANKVVDATAFKMPIITGYSNGLREFFDCKNDILCVKNEPEEMAKAVMNMSKMEISGINDMINRAYEVYLNYFSKDSFIQGVKMIINESNK